MFVWWGIFAVGACFILLACTRKGIVEIHGLLKFPEIMDVPALRIPSTEPSTDPSGPAPSPRPPVTAPGRDAVFVREPPGPPVPRSGANVQS